MSIQLAVIGGGNMARAIINGAIAGDVLKSNEIAVADPDVSARAYFESIGCKTFTEASACPHTPYALIAVKPQTFEEIASMLKADVIYSIMAGVTINTISTATKKDNIVRIMPNLPCAIGLGAAGISVGENTSQEDTQLARSLFSAIGIVVDVEESCMDAVTAVSGSGPAYIFLLAQAMIRGATEAGLDAETADQLVRQTIRGAAELMSQDPHTPSELREAVTSKGGTTAAALDVMMDAGFIETVANAILAARDRGQNLGR